MRLDDLAAAVGGRLAGADPSTQVSSVAIDSRHAEPGALFVALPGEHVDGHDYGASALAAGAVAVLGTRETDVPTVVVPNSLAALAALAGWQRARLDALVIGITGSSGKTSTKDLVAQMLARAGETVAPVSSFNNEIGVPLTVFRAAATTRFLVVELSARGVGQIRDLCEVVAPEVGVVLNVGTAHLGEFGSRAAIAQTKGELVEALPVGGLAVLNADDPLVSAMASRTRTTVALYGAAPGAHYRAEDVTLDDTGRAAFRLVTPQGAAPVRLCLYGVHQVGNALAAAAVGERAGLSVEVVADALTTAVPRSRWRMEVRTTPDGITVINDAYNANPESMRAAVSALCAYDGARHWAVLGEMAELGDVAVEEHESLGRLVAESGVDRLVVVGEGAQPLHAAASARGTDAAYVDDADAAVALLQRELRPGDVVLVKASRAVGLERVALVLTPDEVISK